MDIIKNSTYTCNVTPKTGKLTLEKVLSTKISVAFKKAVVVVSLDVAVAVVVLGLIVGQT